MKNILVNLSSYFEQVFQNFLLPSDKELKAFHENLFHYFIPYEGNDPALIQAIEQSRKNHYAILKSNRQVLWIIVLILKPALLLSKRFIHLYYKYVEKTPVDKNVIAHEVNVLSSFYQEVGKRQLHKMTYEEKVRFFNLLINSKLNFYRRIGSGTRVYFIVNAYRGEVGRLIAKIGDYKMDAFTPDPDIVVPTFKTPLQFDTRKLEFKEVVDYIVIGTGPSGCLVASELQKKGKSVVIMESGSFFMPGTFDGRAGLHFYEDRGFRTTQDGGTFVLNGSVVGGGATVNVDMAFEPSLPTVKSRFDKWKADHHIDDNFWTEEELKDAHNQVLSTFETRTVATHEINVHNNILKKGAEALGLNPSLYRLNTYAPGESPNKRTDKIGPVERYLLASMLDDENPVTLISDAEVTQIIMDGQTARGVEFIRSEARDLPGIIDDAYKLNLPINRGLKLYGKKVIVAAGNLGTSLLLKKSAIVNDRIGKGFVMHPFILVLGLFDELVDNHKGTQSSIYVGDYLTSDYRKPGKDFLIESASARPEIGAMLLPGSPKQVLNTIQKYRYLGGIGVLLLEESQESNRVEMDATGAPEIHYQLSDFDKDRFIFGVKESVKIMFHSGAKEVIIPSFEHLSGEKDADSGFNVIKNIEEIEEAINRLRFIPNATLMFAAHMMSGVKIGRSKEVGAVSQDYKLYGTNNVFVVDSSVFPSSVGANPMETIYTSAQVFINRHEAQMSAANSSTKADEVGSRTS